MNNSTEKQAVDPFVPHSGTMCLLDHIIDCNAKSIRCAVDIRQNTVFANSHGVPAWIGIEYMAQAVAAWSGYQGSLQGQSPQYGYLLGTRRYHSYVSLFPLGSQLTVSSQLVFRDESGLGVFDCSITNNDAVWAETSLKVYEPTADFDPHA